MRPCRCERAMSGIAWDTGQCYLCWLAVNRQEYADRWCLPSVKRHLDLPNVANILRGKLSDTHPVECVNLGPVISACMKGDKSRDVRSCEVHDQCTIGYVSEKYQSCAKCKQYSMVESGKTLMPAGVVIGSYKWPSLIALQAHVIRKTCGNVPILVSDDANDPLVAEICAKHGLEYSANPVRIGHGGGDIAAFWKGIIWAAKLNLKIVAKLSQRMFMLKTNWLGHIGTELLASGLPLAARKDAKHNDFPLRTEACVMDVAQWNVDHVLNSIVPRAYFENGSRYAEQVIYDTLQRHLGGIYWPWTVLTEHRNEKSPGTLWHNSHERSWYETLAKEFDVQLEEDFHCSGWQAELAKGRYKYG